MYDDLLKAYHNWKNATPASEDAALQLLIKAAMDQGAGLSKLFTTPQVRAAVTQGTGNPVLGMTVAAAWRIYTFNRPTGPAAVDEATAWIKQLIASGPQRRQFAAVLENLIAQGRRRVSG